MYSTNDYKNKGSVFPCAVGIKTLRRWRLVILCNRTLHQCGCHFCLIPEVPASILLLLTDGVPFDATGPFGEKLLTTESKL